MLTLKSYMITQLQSHGARTMETREVKSSAMVGKLNTLLAPRKKSKTPELQETNIRTLVEKKPPKEYGMHNGSTHVQQIINIKIDDNGSEVSALLKSSIEALCSRKSLNIRELKYNYKVAKDSLENEFHSKYGYRLTEEQFATLQNAKSEKGFNYYATQIIVVMSDPDEKFQDSEWDEDRKAFVLVVKSRTVYTAELLVDVAKEIASIVLEKRESRLKIERNYDNNKVIAIFDDKRQCFRRLRADEETKLILGQL